MHSKHYQTQIVHIRDNGEFIINKDHNIGIAVDSKFGLKMPVIKKINNFNLNEINSNLNEKINLTRDNKLSPSDLSDGVISISLSLIHI